MTVGSILDSRSLIGGRAAELLQRGCPELGWAGDPQLHLVHHRLTGWEVWREEPAEDGSGMTFRRVRWQRPGSTRLDLHQLIASLVASDTRRKGNSAREQVERMIQHNDKVEAEKAEAFSESLHDPLARAYYAAAKELGAV